MKFVFSHAATSGLSYWIKLEDGPAFARVCLNRPGERDADENLQKAVRLLLVAPELAKSVQDLLALLDEVMPQAQVLVFQDYAKLNLALLDARRALDLAGVEQ